jgi:hypothetical protein
MDPMNTAMEIINILATYAYLMLSVVALGLLVIFSGTVVFALWEYKSAGSDHSTTITRLESLKPKLSRTLTRARAHFFEPIGKNV